MAKLHKISIFAQIVVMVVPITHAIMVPSKAVCHALVDKNMTRNLVQRVRTEVVAMSAYLGNGCQESLAMELEILILKIVPLVTEGILMIVGQDIIVQDLPVMELPRMILRYVLHVEMVV